MACRWQTSGPDEPTTWIRHSPIALSCRDTRFWKCVKGIAHVVRDRPIDAGRACDPSSGTLRVSPSMTRHTFAPLAPAHCAAISSACDNSAKLSLCGWGTTLTKWMPWSVVISTSPGAGWSPCRNGVPIGSVDIAISFRAYAPPMQMSSVLLEFYLRIPKTVDLCATAGAESRVRLNLWVIVWRPRELSGCGLFATNSTRYANKPRRSARTPHERSAGRGKAVNVNAATKQKR